MTQEERIEKLLQQLYVYRMERETLLRIIKELWDIICRYDSEMMQ